jgi:integral membrane sensor domain MASE1
MGALMLYVLYLVAMSLAPEAVLKCVLGLIVIIALMIGQLWLIPLGLSFVGVGRWIDKTQTRNA